MIPATAIRPPAVAGAFYPGDADTLARDVDRMIGSVGPQTVEGKLLGIVVPHAGYPYSGSTAAHAFSLLQALSPKTVILIGPSHRDYFEGVSVYPGSAYRTPLGDVLVDGGIRSALISKKVLPSVDGHRSEHCLEVQIPFLQRVLREFAIVPLVMGTQSREECEFLGRILAEVLAGKEALVVASSDLSHYHPQDLAETLDSRVAAFIDGFNTEALMRELEAESVEACGGGPIVALMRATAAMGANRAKVLHRCTSGDVSGDRSAVVGYLSASFSRVD